MFPGPASDTITVTPDGRTIVDAQKLMRKEHIRTMLADIRRKTIYRRTRKPAADKSVASI
jgi:hypothetical protein